MEQFPNARTIHLTQTSSRRHKRLSLRRILNRILSSSFTLTLFILVLAIALSPILDMAMLESRYDLKPAVKVLDSVNSKLASKITYDPSKQIYQFNKDAANQTDQSGPHQRLGGEDGSSGLYGVDFSVDPSKGITIHDAESKIDMSFVPQFKTEDGKLKDGRLVYPLKDANGQMVYSLTGVGPKEDLVLKSSSKDTQTFNYLLNLPNSLEARMLPGGAVGIYSADPALFGNISYGSDKDQQKVEAARQNGQKTHLTFIIPAPIIKQAGGKESTAKAKFELNKNTLSVKATGLKKATYPLSIDPSFVVNSAASWALGNNESGTDFDTSNNLIKRGAVTGGTVGSWTTDGDSFTTARHTHTTVAYNGYIYVIGGCSAGSDGNCNTFQNDVQYAAINSDGSIGSFSSTTAFTTARYFHTSVVYNGYLYVIGGCSAGNACASSGLQNDVQYAKINSNGTVGTWNTTSTFTTARFGHTSVAYNGYLYILGGCNAVSGGNCTSAGSLNDVQYAAIKGDGTVGSWSATTSFTTGRYAHGSVAYNGHLYVLAGCSGSGCNVESDVQHASTNSDGTLSAWTTDTKNLNNSRWGFTTYVSNGYMYVAGGCTSSSPNNCGNSNKVADVQYAPINSDGSVGGNVDWTFTTSFSTGRHTQSGAFYNGYLYVLGGCSLGACGTFQNDVQYSKVDTAGTVKAWTSTTAFTTARYGHASVAYNGFLYVYGGCSASTSGNCSTFSAAGQKAAIASDGTVGTWSSSGITAFTTARYGHVALAYNGFMYVIGGCSANTSAGCSTFQAGVQKAAIAADGTIGSWSATTAFTTARYGHTALVYNGFMYVIGGCSASTSGNCSTFNNDVQYNTINSDGTLGGTWSTTNTFSTARYGHSSVVARGYLYVIGGCSADTSAGCSTFNNDVQKALIDSSGTVGTWSSTTSFTTARYWQSAVAEKGYLYVLGGCSAATSGNCSTFQNDVQYALINSDGTLGSWSTTSSFTTASYGLFSVAVGGYLYAIGGCSADTSAGCSTFQSSVQYALINNGGTGQIGSFNGTTTLSNRAGHASVAYNGYLYVTGGCSSTSSGASCSTMNNDVQYAAIDYLGNVGSWGSAGNTFSTARFDHTAVAYKGYLYILGGCDTTTTSNGTHCNGYRSDVQKAAFNSNGTIGTFSSTSSFTTARFGHASAAYNGYMYVFGGCSGTANDGTYCASGQFLSDVQKAAINSDGTLGSFSSTTSFTTSRVGLAGLAYNGYIYVLGGCSAADKWCTTFLADVQFAPLNSDGTVGTWAYTNNFATGRFLHNAVATNGFIILSAGCSTAASQNCTTLNSDVQTVPINSNGTLGSWATVFSLANAKAGASMAYYNGFLYSTCGCTGFTGTIPHCNNFTGEIRSSSRFEVISRTAIYSRLFDAEGDASATKWYWKGTLLNSNGLLRLTYKSAPDSTDAFGSATTPTLPASGVLDLFSVPEMRYNWLFFTIDDTDASAFPDSQSTMTNIELFYHPAPARRLRGGKTFTGGSQQSLDATPN